MIIKSPDPTPRKVDDYEFVFTSGYIMPVTIDNFLGDSIEFTDSGVTIHLVAKPSIADPAQTMPAEDVTIFLRHLCSVVHRVRELIPQTVEQKLEWKKTLQELVSKTVN